MRNPTRARPKESMRTACATSAPRSTSRPTVPGSPIPKPASATNASTTASVRRPDAARFPACSTRCSSCGPYATRRTADRCSMRAACWLPTKAGRSARLPSTASRSSTPTATGLNARATSCTPSPANGSSAATCSSVRATGSIRSWSSATSSCCVRAATSPTWISPSGPTRSTRPAWTCTSRRATAGPSRPTEPSAPEDARWSASPTPTSSDGATA